MLQKQPHIKSFILKRIIASILLFGTLSVTFGQSNILDKKINIDLQNMEANAVMDSIAQKANCYFTYNADLFPENKLISIQKSNESIETILFTIIPDSLYSFEQINKHIIIVPKQNQTQVQSEIKDQIFYKKINGIISTKNTPLPYANIGIKGKSKGTISNLDGEFSLSVSNSEKGDTIVISYLGYKNKEVPVKSITTEFINISLKKDFISLQEVVIRNNDPQLIVQAAIKKIKENYSLQPYNSTSFYRESVLKNNKYMIYLESILGIYKKPHLRQADHHRVKLLKSRKIYDHSRLDTVSLRLRGGIEGCLNIDIINQRPTFLDPDFFDLYNYQLVDITSYNDKSVYVIEFTPLDHLPEPLLMGRMLIEIENLAIIQAEFSYQEKRLKEIRQRFVQKSSNRTKVKPIQIEYLVNYKKHNGKYFLNHSLGKLQFKVKNRRKLFYKTFKLSFEMATNQIDTENIKKFPYRESIPQSTVMSKENFTYDSNFWGSKNFITPEKEIEKALRRIQERIQEVALARYSDL